MFLSRRSLSAWSFFCCALMPVGDFAMGGSRPPACGAPTLHHTRLNIFQAAVMRSFGVSAGDVQVQPKFEGLPDNPFDPLATGDLVAMRADITGRASSVYGFFDVTTGHAAFLGYKAAGIGQVGELDTLMKACQVLDAKKSLPLKAVVSRLAWIYSNSGRPVELPNRDWRMERKQGSAVITFFLQQGGETGVLLFSQVQVTVAEGYRTTAKFERIQAKSP